MRFLWRKEGHTRCAAERRDPRAACRRASVSHQDRSWRVRPGSRMLFRDWSFGPQEGSLGLTRHWSSRRCCWPWCIPAVLWRVVLSSSIAEQRRWSFGQRVADFSIPLVCRVSGGQPASLSFGCQIRRSVGSPRGSQTQAGWTTVFDALVESICALAATTLSCV